MTTRGHHGLMLQSAGGGGGNTDDFGTNTIANYTEYGGAPSSWGISGGTMNASGGGTQSVLTRNGISFANGEVSAVVLTAADTGVALRLADANNYYLAVIYDQSASVAGNRSKVILYKRVSGTFTALSSLTSIPTFTRGTPTQLTLAASGTSLIVKVDGVSYITTTDSSISAAGKCGMRNNGAGGGISVFDSFTWP